MTAPRGGYFGRVLEVDLSRNLTKVRELPDGLARKYIGGAGLGGHFLTTEYGAGHDPGAEDSFIFIGPGPLNGTYCPSTRTSIVNQSMYTGLLSHAEVGGHFGNEIKWAGWDGIYITGRAKKPVWLAVNDERAEIRDASAMWGKDIAETDEMIISGMKDPYARTAAIGPAGENGVPFACVMFERFRSAARSGTGALMGNKKLKGIGVRGSRSVPTVIPARFLEAARQAERIAVEREGWQGIKRWGTAGLLEQKQWVTSSLVTRNYQTTWYPDVERIGAECANRTFWRRHIACSNCPVHCRKMGVIREGKFRGLISGGPEYETGGLLGSNLMMKDFAGMMALIEACDALGLDAVSTGGILGFTTECFEKGVLTAADLDGIRVSWGDTDAYRELIHKIAFKEGKAGELLSKGVKKMSEEIGKSSDAWAVHVRGKEIAAHDPRGDKGRVYSYAMGSCGGDHHEGSSPEEQVRWAMINSLCICSFVGGYAWSKEAPGIVITMLNPLCGWNMTSEEYWMTGRRIVTMERCFNIREGASRATDRLPRRFMTEPLPEGPKKGTLVTEEEDTKMHDTFYRYHGWDEYGIPTEDTLTSLGLEYLIDDIRKARKKMKVA
jgi:aldehyde:ferredoxin oxidoreductase